MPQKHKETIKFRKWALHYLDNSDPKLFGNATEAAMRVYNAKNRASASNIGYENVRKLENLLPMMAESLDLMLPRLLKELYEKAKSFDELERFMVRLGFFQSEKQLLMNLNQQNNQYDFSNLAEAFTQARKERGILVPNDQKSL